MADAVISVEARLKDYVTKNIDKIVKDVKRVGENGGKSFDKASTATTKFQSVLKRTGGDLANFMMRFGPAAIAIGLVTKAFFSLKKAYDFMIERTKAFTSVMSQNLAIIQPTREGYKKLTAQAQELGATTVFTATQAGEAFKEMGKLGMNTNEIIAASTGVLDLAAMAGVGMADAAAIAGQTLKQFNLDASNTSHIVDVMAKSFTTSALDIWKFSNAMKMVGPIAGNTGETVEKTSAALAVLADRGIAGSLAGTGLRRVMLELADDTSKANKFIREAGIDAFTFQEKLEGLQEAGIDATSATEMFGLRATTTAQILAQNAKTVAKLTTEYENADGAAKRMAETMLDNLQGATIKLTSAQEGLALAVGEAFAPGRKMVIEAQTELVRAQTEAVKEGVVQAEELASAWQKVQRWWYKAKTEALKSRIEQKERTPITGGMQPGVPLPRGGEGVGGERFLSLKEEAEVLKRVNALYGDITEVENKSGKFINDAAKSIDDMAKKQEHAAGSVDRLRAAMGRQVAITKELAKVQEKDDTQTGEGAKDAADKAAKAILAAERKFQDAKLSLIADTSKRSRAILVERQRRELEDLGTNLAAKTLFVKAHELELEAFARNQAQQQPAIDSQVKAFEAFEAEGSAARIDAARSLKEAETAAKIAGIKTAAERERAELIAQQAQEIEDIKGHGVAIAILEQAHRVESITLDNKLAATRKAAEEQNRKRALRASVQAMDSLLAATSSFKDKIKPIYVALAIMRAAAATIMGIELAWEGGKDIGGVPGVIYGLAMGVATVAANAALLGSQLSAVQSARTGTDQVVRGEKFFRAGEAGPERVSITPTSTDMESGAFSGSGGQSVVFSNTYNIGGDLDQAAADSIIEAEERLAMQIAEVRSEGF